MIDRARLTIIASVPFAMIFQLFLLNYYFNPQINSQIKPQINSQIEKPVIQNTIKKVNTKVKVEKKVYGDKQNNHSLINPKDIETESVIAVHSPPAPHTFVVNDSEI